MNVTEYVSITKEELDAFSEYMLSHHPDLTDLEPGDWDEQFAIFVEMRDDGTLRE